MEDMLQMACRKLRLGNGIVEKAKKIKKKTHMEFLVELFTAEVEERDRKRRNAYMKAAKFDLLKTFEDYTFEDIKFPAALTVDDLLKWLHFAILTLHFFVNIRYTFLLTKTNRFGKAKYQFKQSRNRGVLPFGLVDFL